jgi:hypothetical protein
MSQLGHPRQFGRVPTMSVFGGCSQLVDATLYLERKDGVSDDGSTISSRVYGDREDGVMGSLAARGIAEGDWPGVWQAVVVNIFPVGTARVDSSSATAALAIGVDACGTRGDIQRYCAPRRDDCDQAPFLLSRATAYTTPWRRRNALRFDRAQRDCSAISQRRDGRNQEPFRLFSMTACTTVRLLHSALSVVR